MWYLRTNITTAHHKTLNERTSPSSWTIRRGICHRDDSFLCFILSLVQERFDGRDRLLIMRDYCDIDSHVSRHVRPVFIWKKQSFVFKMFFLLTRLTIRWTVLLLVSSWLNNEGINERKKTGGDHKSGEKMLEEDEHLWCNALGITWKHRCFTNVSQG